MRTVVVVVVDRGSRKKRKESMSNAGGVVESEGLLSKGSTAIISVVQRSKEECPYQFYRRTTDSLSGTRATDGAEWRRWRRWYGADINPLLMKYHKSGDKIYYGRIEKASTN